MNTRLFEYLKAVVETGSFRRAADHCGVSQPALSIQIKKLEEVLGATLIERNNREILLTDAGKETLKRAETILKDINSLKETISLSADPYSGSVSLGAFPTLSPYIFPRTVNDLRETYPRISFMLVEEKTDTLIEMLEKGELDAAFIATPYDNKEFDSDFIMQEHFLLAVPESHELASQNSISDKELAKLDIMLLAEGHCLRDQTIQLCSMLSEKDTFKASSLTTLIQMVRLGNGITLIPECAATAIPGIKYLEITGTSPGRSISLFWRTS